MNAVLYKTVGPWWKLGGMTLFERNLRYLDAAGIESVVVIYPRGEIIPTLDIPLPLGLYSRIEKIEYSGNDPLNVLAEKDLGNDHPLLLFNANLLLDTRVLEKLSDQVPPCFMYESSEDDVSSWRVGLLRSEDLTNSLDSLKNVTRLSLNDVSSYAVELRGEAITYCTPIESEQELVSGWKLLIQKAQKRQGDLIEKYVHPKIQNWMVRKICDTPITPNQISILVVLFAVIAAILFYQGNFFFAYFLAFIATVLDGVDGKLARTKLMTSKVGELEHVFDYFYENSWYLALAANMAQTYGPVAWVVGLSITTFDTCDKIVGALFKNKKGKTLDEMDRFDRFFRLIGGRRSIYLHILLMFFIINLPFSGMIAVLAWAGITVLIHASRAAFHLLHR
jgi:phosphatidylglycerophosphate synthase